jgi:hypothetical protein
MSDPFAKVEVTNGVCSAPAPLDIAKASRHRRYDAAPPVDQLR